MVSGFFFPPFPLQIQKPLDASGATNSFFSMQMFWQKHIILTVLCELVMGKNTNTWKLKSIFAPASIKLMKINFKVVNIFSIKEWHHPVFEFKV